MILYVSSFILLVFILCKVFYIIRNTKIFFLCRTIRIIYQRTKYIDTTPIETFNCIILQFGSIKFSKREMLFFKTHRIISENSLVLSFMGMKRTEKTTITHNSNIIIPCYVFDKGNRSNPIKKYTTAVSIVET